MKFLVAALFLFLGFLTCNPTKKAPKEPVKKEAVVDSLERDSV